MRNLLEMFKLHDNSPTGVKSVTLLSSSDLSKNFIMHYCDYEAGAWFRTTNEEEQHLFYDPATETLHTINGIT